MRWIVPHELPSSSAVRSAPRERGASLISLPLLFLTNIQPYQQAQGEAGMFLVRLYVKQRQAILEEAMVSDVVSRTARRETGRDSRSTMRRWSGIPPQVRSAYGEDDIFTS